jgi:Ca-activated chloride channel family protein
MNFRTVLLAVFLLILAAVPVRAEEGSRVILVLDASGSMWGQIDGKSKMEIAKEVVGRVVGAWKPENELGLVAYGHREKGSCEDIEVLREPGPLDAGDYMSAVNALNPKGKTPMTAAVRMAAESLKYTERKASVILVSDGIETCGLDPCAVAEELEKLGVDLTVHTVGFGLDDQGAVAQLKCLAEKTGGTYTTAENADELEAALTKTVEATPAPPPEPVAPAFNVTGHVMMAKGVELSQGYESATWEFFDVVDGQKGQWIQTEYGTDIKINLPRTGDFIVRVSDDVAAVELPMTLEVGEVEKLDVSLEAGILRLSGMMDETTAMTDAGAAWELLDSSGKWITTKYGAETAFLANAGVYKVRLSLGAAKVEQDIEIAAGKLSEQKIALGAGVVEVSAVFSSGGQAVPEGATIELRKPDAGPDGTHEWISTEYAMPSRFKVPAGKYLVVVIRDYATASLPVEVTAANTAKAMVDLQAGYLAVTGPNDSTSFEIFAAEKDLSGARKQIGTEYYGTFNKAFSAGAYHVIAKSADGAVLGEKDFDVKAGGRTEGAIP